MHLILFSLFLKQFRLGACTVSWSKLFHLSVTRFEKKYILISVLNLGLQILLLWPRKPLYLPSSVNKTLMSISVYPKNILNTSIKSPRFLLSSNVCKPNLKSLCPYGKDKKSSIILVNLCCTLSSTVVLYHSLRIYINSPSSIVPCN